MAIGPTTTNQAATIRIDAHFSVIGNVIQINLYLSFNVCRVGNNNVNRAVWDARSGYLVESVYGHDSNVPVKRTCSTYISRNARTSILELCMWPRLNAIFYPMRINAEKISIGGYHHHIHLLPFITSMVVLTIRISVSKLCTNKTRPISESIQSRIVRPTPTKAWFAPEQ